MKQPSSPKYSRAWLSALVIFTILLATSGCQNIPILSRSTGQRIQDASESLAKQLAENRASNNDNRPLLIGIQLFAENSDQSNTIAHALIESLKVDLFRTKRFEVVEDENMRKVLKAIELQESSRGVLTPETIYSLNDNGTNRLANLPGVDAIVVGTISSVDSDYLISCRLVPLKRGVIGGSGRAMIPKGASYAGEYVTPSNYPSKPPSSNESIVPLPSVWNPVWNH
jgi:hypothetical protein